MLATEQQIMGQQMTDMKQTVKEKTYSSCSLLPTASCPNLEIPSHWLEWSCKAACAMRKTMKVMRAASQSQLLIICHLFLQDLSTWTI